MRNILNMKKMQTTALAIMALLIMAPLSFAQQTVNAQAEAGLQANAETTASAGSDSMALDSSTQATTAINGQVAITPDSPLWDVKVALEKISLALTFDKAKRAEKALQQAKKRLLEVEAMIQENKVDAAAKARARHTELLADVEAKVNAMDKTDVKAELREKIRLRSELEMHENEVEDLDERTKIHIQIKGELTTEQRSKLEDFIESMKSASADVRVKVSNSEERTKVKIAQKNNRTKAEIESEIESLEDEVIKAHFEKRAELALKQADQQIEVTKNILEKRSEASASANASASFGTEHLEAAVKLRAEAKAEFDAGHYLKAIELALKAKAQSQIARIGIEAETKGRLDKIRDIEIKFRENEGNERNGAEHNIKGVSSVGKWEMEFETKLASTQATASGTIEADDDGKIEFSGTIGLPNQCYSTTLLVDAYSETKIINLNVKTESTAAICTEAIANMEFEGELKTRLEGNWTVVLQINGVQANSAEIAFSAEEDDENEEDDEVDVNASGSVSSGNSGASGSASAAVSVGA